MEKFIISAYNPFTKEKRVEAIVPYNSVIKEQKRINRKYFHDAFTIVLTEKQ